VIERLTVLVGIYSPFAAWNIPASHVERLRRELPHHTFLHAPTEARALELIGTADVAFMSELRQAHLEAAPRLRWVHSPAAGVGGMLFPAMIDSPVVMSNSRGISADTIAEHVLAVILARFRKLPLAFRSQGIRQWTQEAFVADPAIRTIAGSRVLIAGLGSIGSATARRLAALGARVTATRRNPGRPAPEGIETVAPPGRLRDLLPGADVVVVAAPQTRDTRALIGAPELAAMRRDALLVNVSRGKLVDEPALIEALTNTPTLGAALDVFEEEPLPLTSPLWSLPNVLVTPHISGFRADHWDAVTALFADNLRRFESGRPILNIVDKAAGY
jgi:phosphoglycerate dehydrogenase-like enzyme